MIELTKELDPQAITHCRVAAMKIEDNIEHWIKIWIIFGYIDKDIFIEWHGVQGNAVIGALEFHLEDGVHPLDSSRRLCQCPNCNKWYTIEVECPVCKIATEPYDAYTRLINTDPRQGQSCYSSILYAINNLVISEQVPDPITDELRYLIDGSYVVV